MAISDLYSSGKHKQQMGHFANIVKIAKADGIISDDEKALLTKASKNLNISEDKFTTILNNPEKFPINAPISYDERLERLYRLSKMVLANGKVKSVEVKLMEKIAIGLNFKVEKTKLICKEAISLVLNNSDLDDFINGIKKVDKT
ncbi:TerB family tellurite resistance protein [uncultured Polaribacter sp.]|uniref:TerB family tellurite resistance protein n=1 Tax=uncultured Polaribacter sp. TaxID=174711 RepID=UPI0026160753|nr:TerB family tellurite resistance protein [uncultured Polaribacter sp.]